MTELKHTPAPWEACDVGDYSDYDGQCRVILGDDLRIAVALGDHDESEANASLIAAAPDLLAALDGLHQFFAMPDECSIGRFDRLAEQYRRETGNWAPGKSIPDAYNDSTDNDTRRKEYDAWLQSKVDAARAAIAKAKG